MIGEVLRAKSKEEKNYLLKDHIKETIKRATDLRRFVEENKRAIEYKGYNEDFFKNLVTACFLHDLGKINPTFQKEVFDKKEKEYDKEKHEYKDEKFKQIMSFFGNYKSIEIKDHEVLSVILSSIFLENDEWDKKIKTAILLHHYNDFYVNRERNIRCIFDDYPDLEEYLDFLLSKKDEIKKVLEFFIEEAKEENSDDITTKTLDELKNKINLDKIETLKHNLERGHSLSSVVQLFEISDKEDENFYDFFVFLGALRRCDYSASGNVEIEKNVNISRDVYCDLEDEINKKVKESNRYFWQKEILQKYDSKNLVLVAPTGSGKTEFALLWAKNRGKKLLYTLPLRVALNDLYLRFNKKEKGYFEEDFLRILHSTSFIEYLKENRGGDRLDVESKEVSSELFASPLLLTTPDQVFLSCLKYYGFDKLLNVYPVSAVVVDEVQTYNPEMAAIIIKTLEMIQKLNGNILVMTATFPPYLGEFANERGFQVIDLKREDEKTKESIKNYKLKRHKILPKEKVLFDYSEEKKERKDEEFLEINGDSFKEVKKIINENRNKNILIIVNNVGKAVKLFKELEKETKENLYLLHSRLLEKEKSKRVNEIKEKLKNKEVGLILVATQIVEASVDVDFDILITEVSPIDSQIQRWGRIYRNRKNDYNEESPNVFIFVGKSNDKGELEIDRGTSAIYDEQVVKKTIEVLKRELKISNSESSKVLNYEEERALIDKVFEEKIGDRTLKQVYIDKIKENLEWLKYTSAEKRSEAQRIFRRIAGIQIVIPGLMKESSDKIEKAFGEVIEEIKENKKLPWEIIVDEVKKKLELEEDKQKVNKFELKKILYLYSVNVPFFSFDESFSYTFGKEFKGFQILDINKIGQNLNDIKKYLNDIKKYGITKIFNVNIDKKEIEESEEFEDRFL
ncbi:MAG: CRISPR-associated helicase Cas3' [Fervidicoccus fontis]